MSDAPAQQKTHGRPRTDIIAVSEYLKNRGLDAINGRTRAGKEAKRWEGVGNGAEGQREQLATS